jgi:hypothetical protein
MKLAKYLVAAAISSAFIAAPASAGALGAADLTINNFFLTTGTAPITTGINILTETRTGNASSSFNGVQGTGAGSNDMSSNIPGTTVDVAARCAGPDCGMIGENDMTTHLAGPSGNFALGDMFIAGSIFNATGANGMTRANASVENASNYGSANSTIQNAGSAITTFSIENSVLAAFAVQYDAYVAALIEASTPGNHVASASSTISWALTLRKQGVGTVMSWSPDELNDGRYAANLAQSDSYGSSGTIFSTFYNFQPGTYTLTINQASNATASEVPEPGSMILVGLGLAALGAAGRRRRIAK